MEKSTFKEDYRVVLSSFGSTESYFVKGTPCPLEGVTEKEVDMLFIRENSEGEYAGSGSWIYKGKPNKVVVQNGVFSRVGCERVIRYAYELARKQKKLNKHK